MRTQTPAPRTDPGGTWVCRFRSGAVKDTFMSVWSCKAGGSALGMEVFCWLQCVHALANDWFPRPDGHSEHDVHGSRLRGTTWTE